MEDLIALLNAVPAVVRILVVFALLLVAIKRKWALGNVFVAGAAVLGLLFAMGPLAIARSMALALIHPKTVGLSLVVCLILVLSHSLEATGQMQRLLDRFRGLVRRPMVNLVIFPALIGLLPMPGGAVFSAPMVKTLGRWQKLDGDQLSYINYWFRHIWEYWWPLYPGVLLTTALAGIDLWHFVLFMCPLTAVALTAGYWPLRHAMDNSGGDERSDPPARRRWAPFLKELAPIAFVIVAGLGTGLALSAWLPAGFRPLAKESGLILALMVAIGWIWRANRLPVKKRWAILRQPALLKMFYMVAAILIFKGILEDSGAVDRVSEEFLRWRIPLASITILMPFLVGAVAGITLAFVGATFPILISLIQTLGQADLMMAYLMLAMASGFVGVLVSPLHLCLLLSNAYFKTAMLPVYRLMALPLAGLLAAGCLYFWAAATWLPV